MATREASEPLVAELESSVFLGQPIMTDTWIMRVMKPSQLVQEQRGANQERLRKAPRPNILDKEMDLRQSQKIRRADAAAASPSAGGQQTTSRASAKARKARRSLSSSSESDNDRLCATIAAEPVEGTKDTSNPAKPATPLTPSAQRLGSAEAGSRGDVDDGDMKGSRRRVASVAITPQATVHPNNPDPNKTENGRFSFIPGDDNLLSRNSQVEGQSTPRVHEQVRLRHG